LDGEVSNKVLFTKAKRIYELLVVINVYKGTSNNPDTAAITPLSYMNDGEYPLARATLSVK
jgi:hypothetical protein